MKLLQHTYRRTVLGLLPVLLLGSLFSYWMIQYISYEEADEYLGYEMDRIVLYHQRYDQLPDDHRIAALFPDVALSQAFYRDTLILEPADNELVPYRELHFPLIHKGQSFVVVLRHLLPGRDDVVQGTVWIVLGLVFLIGLMVWLMLSGVNQRIWKPFYQTLHRLNAFKLSEPLPVLPVTDIDEFARLNTTLDRLLRKAKEDFRHNKEFSENLSHELQTHLAVMRTSMEQLLNQSNRDQREMEQLSRVYQSLMRLSKTQRSLALLSRIGNWEYEQAADVDMLRVVERTLRLFQEAIELRSLSLSQELHACVLRMDPGLADILVENLVKNAVKHNVDQGQIRVFLSDQCLCVENTGDASIENPQQLTRRYAKGKTGNMGLGLYIVQEICQLYGFRLEIQSLQNLYRFEVYFCSINQ